MEADKPDNDSITILPKNVLVVDDDPILLKIAEDMLGRKGVSCTSCMNFQEVVAALGQSDYDMVLTDVQMPDADGFALLRLLRNTDIGNSKTIPIAVMTARGDTNTGIYEKKDSQVVFISRSIYMRCLLFYHPLCLKQEPQIPMNLISPVYWKTRMIMYMCCLWLLTNPEKNLRNWNQP